MTESGAESEMFLETKSFSFQRGPEAKVQQAWVSEVVSAGFQNTTWSGALVLGAWLVAHAEEEVKGRRVLELGAGTGLVGVVAALLGAAVVKCTDRDHPSMMNAINRTITLNLSRVGKRMSAAPLDYGLLQSYDEPYDLIVGSDLLYSAENFDDILFTVASFLSVNPSCTFVTSYHERSPHRSLAAHLYKFNLEAEVLKSPLLYSAHSSASDGRAVVVMKGRGEEEVEVDMRTFSSIHLIRIKKKT